jgi:8-oxo-dGTP pyrophosphatase MutT (NUDIX family)
MSRNLQLLAEEPVVWADGQIRLRLWTYFGADIPQLELITSARALIFNHDTVLVQRDVGSTHILPGGRREAGETLEQTARREVLEETGWEVGPLSPLGVLHFRHQTPKPVPNAYPYPDFFHVVYTADAVLCRPAARLDDGHEIDSRWMSLEQVRALALPDGQRHLLQAAVSLRFR